MYSEEERHDVRTQIMRKLCEQEDRSIESNIRDIAAALNITDWHGIVLDEARRLHGKGLIKILSFGQKFPVVLTTEGMAYCESFSSTSLEGIERDMGILDF